MIPISKPTIEEEEINAVLKVLRSGKLTQGKIVSELEQNFAKYCGTQHGATCINGTAALHTALYSIGINPEDEVITTPFTFAATANSILMMRALPVFVDIDPITFNIDPTKIEEAITKKTKAILVVNLYGQPAEFDEINSIAKKNNLIVIEDAAQSVGAEYKNKKSGNLADISCFSFYATKNIMCGEGGMITTNNKNYYEKTLSFRNHGQSNKLKYYYADIGYNYRMTDILASIALTQLKKIENFIKERQMIAQRYTKELKDIKGIITPITIIDRAHVFHQYTIRVTKDFKLKRDKLKNYLYKKGIQSNIYYPQPLYGFNHLKVGKKQKNYPITEIATRECLSLPIYSRLNTDKINYIINQIRNV